MKYSSLEQLRSSHGLTVKQQLDGRTGVDVTRLVVEMKCGT